MASRTDILLALLHGCLCKGQWKVAIRRYFMLLACACEVPAEVACRCQALVANCPRKELEFIACAALAWADMVCPAAVARPLMLQLPIGPVALGLEREKAAPPLSPPPRRRQGRPAAVASKSGSRSRATRHERPPLAPHQASARRQRVHKFIQLHAAFHGIPALSGRDLGRALRARGANSTVVRKLGMRLDGQEA